jgi:hypothetical protein
MDKRGGHAVVLGASMGGLLAVGSDLALPEVVGSRPISMQMTNTFLAARLDHLAALPGRRGRGPRQGKHRRLSW